MEVVNSFTGDDALMEFRRWVLSPDTDAIKAAAKKGKGRGRKKDAAAEDQAEADTAGGPADGSEEPPLLREFKRKHRTVRCTEQHANFAVTLVHAV